MENTKEMLLNISGILKDREQEFRTLVCRQCGWSEATYYRKRKNSEKLSAGDRTVIHTVLHEILKDIITKINQLIQPKVDEKHH